MTDYIQYPAAKLHKFLHAAPLFNPLKRGSRKKDIKRQHISRDKTQKLAIRFSDQLDIADQDLWFCLVAIARDEKKSFVVSARAKQEKNILLRKKLNLNGKNIIDMPTLGARSTIYELLKELGKSTGGSDYEWLIKSLDRLAGVSCKLESNNLLVSFQLMSWSSSLDKNDKPDGIDFCINPYSTEALDKSNDPNKKYEGYVLVHRGERAQLKTDVAKGLHAVLCSLVDMGCERNYNIDMLADKVYTGCADDTADAISYRRSKIIAAIKNINDLDRWDIVMKGKGINGSFKIVRKKRTLS